MIKFQNCPQIYKYVVLLTHKQLFLQDFFYYLYFQYCYKENYLCVVNPQYNLRFPIVYKIRSEHQPKFKYWL